MGQAHQIQVRSEGGERDQRTIVSFRVERFNDQGNLILLLPVEMRGLSFEGQLSEGDWVSVKGRRRGGTLRASVTENLTTGATMRAKGVPAVSLIFRVFILVAFGFFFLYIALSILGAVNSFGPPAGFH